MGQNNKLNTYVFLSVFFIVLGTNLYLFKNMFHPLAFAAIIGGAFYPLFRIIGNRFNLSKEWSSLATCGVILLILVLPMIYLFLQLSKETVDLYGTLKTGLSEGAVKNFLFGEGTFAVFLAKVLKTVGSDLTNEDLYQMVLQKAQSYSGIVISTINSIVGDTFSFLFSFLIMMMGVYGFFLEGEDLKKYIFTLSPLPDHEEQLLLEKFSQMNFVSLVCNGIGGLIQGLLAGIGFWIAGIDSVFLWSTVMIILAFIPLLGISVIYIPACIYLFLTGQKTAAISLFIYCSLIAVLVENWFKPKFIGSRIRVNSLLLLFYIMAGMSTFGMAGIFYGPLLCILLLTVIELFLENYLPHLQKKA